MDRSSLIVLFVFNFMGFSYSISQFKVKVYMYEYEKKFFSIVGNYMYFNLLNKYSIKKQ